MKYLQKSDGETIGRHRVDICNDQTADDEKKKKKKRKYEDRSDAKKRKRRKRDRHHAKDEEVSTYFTAKRDCDLELTRGPLTEANRGPSLKRKEHPSKPSTVHQSFISSCEGLEKSFLGFGSAGTRPFAMNQQVSSETGCGDRSLQSSHSESKLIQIVGIPLRNTDESIDHDTERCDNGLIKEPETCRTIIDNTKEHETAQTAYETVHEKIAPVMKSACDQSLYDEYNVLNIYAAPKMRPPAPDVISNGSGPAHIPVANALVATVIPKDIEEKHNVCYNDPSIAIQEYNVEQTECLQQSSPLGKLLSKCRAVENSPPIVRQVSAQHALSVSQHNVARMPLTFDQDACMPLSLPFTSAYVYTPRNLDSINSNADWAEILSQPMGHTEPRYTPWTEDRVCNGSELIDATASDEVYRSDPEHLVSEDLLMGQGELGGEYEDLNYDELEYDMLDYDELQHDELNVSEVGRAEYPEDDTLGELAGFWQPNILY